MRLFASRCRNGFVSEYNDNMYKLVAHIEFFCLVIIQMFSNKRICFQKSTIAMEIRHIVFIHIYKCVLDR